MDVGSLHKGKKGKAGKEGKGKDGKPTGKGKGNATPCKHCNRPLTQVHTEFDCWYNPKNKSPEAVAKRAAKAKAQPGGKSGKKSEGKRGKGVRSLEEAELPPESEGNEQEGLGC
eukprot:4120625-Karenia_brevis.AAC.1